MYPVYTMLEDQFESQLKMISVKFKKCLSEEYMLLCLFWTLFYSSFRIILHSVASSSFASLFFHTCDVIHSTELTET